MKNLGLDFGTTNSILSYYHREKDLIDCFRMGGAGGQSYIPTVIAYNQEGEFAIGAVARSCMLDEDFYVYDRFKMLLGERDRERLEKYGFLDKLPGQCARDFIGKLIDSFRTEEPAYSEIEGIIITVPQIWITESDNRNAGYLARQELRARCRELGLPLKRLLSEPVAASAYFAHEYHKTRGKWFNGHVMVCDYGGGTLDLSLSRIEEGVITVLECSGKGRDQHTFGKAGVAFDEAVVQSVYQREHDNRPLSRNEGQFIKLMQEFEDLKIKKKGIKIDPCLKHYLRDSSIDKTLFSIDSMGFRASDFVTAFKQVIEPDFIRSLDEISGYFSTHNVDPADRDRFKVIMVGGFSSFWLVENRIREYFQANSEGDPRFDSCFNLTDSCLAISKGAGAVANGLVDIDPLCPMSMGLRLKRDMGGIFKEYDKVILKKGVKMSECVSPVYLDSPVRVSMPDGPGTSRKVSIKVFFGDNRDRRYFELDKSIDQLLPNLERAGNRWEIGFSVDENFFFTMHARDASGEVRETPVGDLLENIIGLVIEDDT